MEKYMERQILIVEDDKNIREGLEDILYANGYRVCCAQDGAAALSLMAQEQIALVILDVLLGEDNGFELCREIRKQWNTPILFLTACSSEMELIRGFQAGGDDYVTKPFRMQELLVRMQALLRRSQQNRHNAFQSGAISFCTEEHYLKKNGEIVELTAIEWKIISVLILHWPNTISREALLYEVWDKHTAYVENNTLNVNISRIREKLGEWQGKKYVETVRGVGYRWAIPVNR